MTNYIRSREGEKICGDTGEAVFVRHQKNKCTNNTSIFFPLNKLREECEKNACYNTGSTVYVNIDGKSICYEGLRESQFRDRQA